MLDLASIFTKSGIVLWSKSFLPPSSSTAIGGLTAGKSKEASINGLVQDVLIQDGNLIGLNADGTASSATGEGRYNTGSMTVQYRFENEFDLIFAVAYQRILNLTYVEDLIRAMRTLFLDLYQETLLDLSRSFRTRDPSQRLRLRLQGLSLEKGPQSSPTTSSTAQVASLFRNWNAVFDKILRQLEARATKHGKANRAAKEAESREREEAEKDAVEAEADGPEEGSAIKSPSRVTGLRGARRGQRGRGAAARQQKGRKADSTDVSESEPGSRPGTPSQAKGKQMRRWDDGPATAADVDALDFSSTTAGQGQAKDDVAVRSLIDREAMGTKSTNGMYQVADVVPGKQAQEELDIDVDAAIAAAKRSRSRDGPAEAVPSASRFSSLLSRLTGASRILTVQDTGPIIAAMREHLMQKNVAKEIADKLCHGVESSLVGKKIEGYKGIKAVVKEALSVSLNRILTPKTSTDILLDIAHKRAGSSSLKEPYAMVFVGVNGVGKSTNLSKVCFWLLQNKCRVLIAACDTFRSGAVEQLRVHVRNLQALCEVENIGTSPLGGEDKAKIELFERGYGKDAAGIAREAINYAKTQGFDVVLIDTAGRMQDNEPLMRALAKLVTTNQPDKIVFVGEALVGNEAVDQLTKFNKALRDYGAGQGATGRSREIDGIILTKFDTIDDKVGAAVSMSGISGAPVLFVGTGQTYTDLRHLRPDHIVESLLKD